MTNADVRRSPQGCHLAAIDARRSDFGEVLRGCVQSVGREIRPWPYRHWAPVLGWLDAVVEDGQ